MRTLLASSIILVTILAALAVGIACGYLIISLILRAMVLKSHTRFPLEIPLPSKAVDHPV